jgi:Cu2+-exporting ATPase
VVRWHGDDGALQFARALEAESAHAVARAFQRKSTSPSPLWIVRTVEHVVEVPGLGIAGRLDGHEVLVGNRTHVEAAGAVVPEGIAAAAVTLVADGLSPVFVALDGRVRGVAGIGDRLRADARETVAALRARGIRVRILSGDHPEIVARVARELGLPDEDALGGLAPEAKREAVARLVGGPGSPPPQGSVIMVGDGVNDAAALALADVGIAVHGGTGATIAASDVVLTREGVAPLVEILDGARRLRGVIRRNLWLSLLYNTAAAAFAMAGLVGPIVAAILMPCSSLTVVASSVTTRTFTKSTCRRPQATGRRPQAPSGSEEA